MARGVGEVEHATIVSPRHRRNVRLEVRAHPGLRDLPWRRHVLHPGHIHLGASGLRRDVREQPSIGGDAWAALVRRGREQRTNLTWPRGWRMEDEIPARAP